jgi:histidinol-phosphate aminotransferase
MKTTRRKFLLGSAGASLCAATAAINAMNVEKIGAFPKMPYSENFLGPKPGFARLDSNENPYGPAKSALRMVEYAGKKGAYYPDAANIVLRDMIAEKYGVARENVAISTGSAEALSAIALVYGRRGPIVAPRLFFDATPLYAQNLGLATIQRAPLMADMSVDIDALEQMISPDTGMVQICNPNNPTGLMARSEDLKPAVIRMAKHAPVVIDEAYIELTDNPEGNSCLDLVKAGHNVIVARTFSKIYGMAGLRVGYVISTPEIISEIQPAIMSWMSAPSLASAIGCLNDDGFLEFSRSKIYEGRNMVENMLNGLGLEYLPSQTNFLYFKTDKGADKIQEMLRDNNISIQGQYMDYQDWSRVSLGMLEDVECFCDALPRVLDA